ncbi:MAG: cyclic nucleotide-binding/CBS domain-containing protein [Rhodospirillaceae bacterium]|nr:cyclic nucleotide-binding/CBS domain-containing protein [Rhodospirillaceae bacterium]
MIDLVSFFVQHAPYDGLPLQEVERLRDVCAVERVQAGTLLYARDGAIADLCVLGSGLVDLVAETGEVVFRYATGDTIGARGLMRDGLAVDDAVVRETADVVRIPRGCFEELLAAYPNFDAFFDRTRVSQQRAETPSIDPSAALLSTRIRDVMTTGVIAVAPDATVADAARTMRQHWISCVLVADAENRLLGMVTTGDLTARVLAEGLSGDTPVHAVMTRDPLSMGPDASLLDAALRMSEEKIGHMPIIDGDRVVGIVTRTNLVRRETLSIAGTLTEIGRQADAAGLAKVVARMPKVLAQLVISGLEPQPLGLLVTSVTDAVTRRLTALAEQDLGPPPIPYLWLACGSQGRQEQTGVSDQDNVLILDDRYDPVAHGPYFEALARRVSDGLNASGYIYCPGDMMATNPRWRQPVSTWRRYFRKWIDKPDPMAQMLASVMFDLRPIVGTVSLFDGIKRETLDQAAKNSIFRAHMVANSLKHVPPLSLFRGFTLIRSGEHKNTLDLKLNGLVPIVDLARVYALDAGLEEVNTRDRLEAAKAAGSLSESGADDLIAVYDLIARIRLEHQAEQIRNGEKPTNFLAPSSLSALERNHLKDAFSVIKTFQSALEGRAAVVS